MAMFGDSTVLVVAAHPDDEVLGCGGTIARHTAAGDRVSVLFLADGVSSRAGQTDDAEVELRKQAASLAAQALGTEPPRFFGGPDNALDSLPLIEIVRAVEAAVADISPNVVYTHHGADLNIDHRIACQAVLTACRPLPDSGVRAIYAFEVPSSTEWAGPGIGPPFVPRRFVDISSSLESKRQAVAAYDDEMRDFPYPRSMEAIEALAKWRGAGAGCPAAEAFDVLREVVP